MGIEKEIKESLAKENREDEYDPDFLYAFLDAVQSDDEDIGSKGSYRLLYKYENESDEVRDVIDMVLITTCGYSLPSLMRMQNTVED